MGHDPPRRAGGRARRRGRRAGRRSSRAGPTVALGLTKWLLHSGRDAPLDEHLRNEAFALELSSRSEDFREGLTAFREKRSPEFGGPLTCTSRSIVERRGPVGWLIFDRPDVGNAMDARMMAELEQAWRELDDDPDVRVIVNTGDGQDVPDRPRRRRSSSRDQEALREQSRRTRDAELALHRVAQPGVEAGDRRGQRRLRRRRAALRRRRRHRDRGERRHVPRPPRVARAGRSRTRRSACAQDGRWSRSCAWRLIGRHERHARGAGLRSSG